MELLRGTIEYDARSSEVMCALGVFHRGRKVSWRGYLIVRGSHGLESINEGGRYHLALEDGRFGEIRAIKVRRDRKGGSMVDFEAAGELTSPELETDDQDPAAE